MKRNLIVEQCVVFLICYIMPKNVIGIKRSFNKLVNKARCGGMSLISAHQRQRQVGL